MSDKSDLDLIALGDRRYNGFPSFDEFTAELTIAAGPYEAALAELQELRESSSDKLLAEVGGVLQRIASVDTGAIEGLYDTDRGFTLSVAQGTIALSQIVVEKGEEFVEHFEAHLLGLEMALDVATTATPLTEAFIRQLHAATTQAQKTYRVITTAGVQDQELKHGEYKEHPNHVLLGDGSVHSYSPVDETPHEMAKLLVELRSDEFQQAHPIIQAAYAHYALVCIHPFADGNGRVVRLLASIYLLRATSVPLVIWADQKGIYLDSLRAADAGDFEVFVRFIRDRTIQALRLAKDMLLEVPEIHDVMSRISGAFFAPTGPTHVELDEMATHVRTALFDDVNAFIRSKELKVANVKTQSSEFDLQFKSNPLWRARINRSAPAISVNFSTPPPASASVSLNFYLTIGVTEDPIDAFQLAGSHGGTVTLSLDEVVPELTAAARERCRRLIDHDISSSVRALGEAVQEKRDKRGY